MYKILREMGAPSHLVDLVESLYDDNTMMVRVDGEESEVFCAEQGMR